MKKAILFLAAGLSFFLSFSGVGRAAGFSDFKTEPMTIVVEKNKEVVLRLAVADTPKTREKGLMGIETLPEKTGMIFLFEKEENAAFWMKGTILPLDMVFIGRDGIVKGVFANAIPFDLTPIYPPEPIVAVLELAGGQAEHLGINRGDKVLGELFRKGLK